jgi:hypothetical protein
MNSWYDFTMELVHTMNSEPTKNPNVPGPGAQELRRGRDGLGKGAEPG